MPSSVCNTPACIHIASEILWSLAPNYTAIDPCNNFDKYACNGWAARNDIPAGQRRTQTLAQTNDLNRWTLKGILEGPYPTGTDAGWITVNLTSGQVAADQENFKQIQSAYTVCLNETAQAVAGLQPLTAFLETIIASFGGGSSSAANVSGPSTLFEGLGIPTLQTLAVFQDDIDPDSNLVAIGPPSFTDIPPTNASLAGYFKVASVLFAAAHPAKPSVAAAEALLRRVVTFETQLLAFATKGLQEQQENATDDTPVTKLSLTALNSQAPALSLPSVLGALVPAGYRVERLLVEAPTYYANASRLVANTSAEILQAFYLWRGIVALAPYIVAEEASDFNRFQISTAGGDPDSQQQQWKDCVDFVDRGAPWLGNWGPSGLSWILGRFFLDKAYSAEARDLTDTILQKLQEEFASKLEDRDWLSDEVKKVAREKVNTINRKVGYPSSPLAVDPLAIQAFYAPLRLTNSYPANVLATARLTVAQGFDNLGKPVDRGAFLSSTTAVNAYYNPSLNEIVLLAGIQQFPIYDHRFPAYLLYGSMGAIAGHELTHGFDNTGRHYDPTGNFTVWWDEETIRQFRNRTTCFVDQYSRFTVKAPNGTDVRINGNRTLGENIADAGGVGTSFGAWRRWEKERNEEDQRLPGLDEFSNAQLFFLKWAQSWCSITPPDVAVGLIRTDVHSPAFARILGPLANSRDFREAFNCPVKEPTCELW